MKAISLHQPWASLIAEGIKTIETRTWAPPKALIGQRIAIHAAKRKSTEGDLYILRQIDPVLKTYQRQHSGQIYPTALTPMGMVVATAVLRCAHQVAYNRDVAHMHPGTWMDCAHWRLETPFTVERDSYGDFTPGRWLWFLSDIERLDPPVPAIGHQGFWNWTT